MRWFKGGCWVTALVLFVSLASYIQPKVKNDGPSTIRAAPSSNEFTTDLLSEGQTDLLEDEIIYGAGNRATPISRDVLAVLPADNGGSGRLLFARRCTNPDFAEYFEVARLFDDRVELYELDRKGLISTRKSIPLPTDKCDDWRAMGQSDVNRERCYVGGRVRTPATSPLRDMGNQDGNSEVRLQTEKGAVSRVDLKNRTVNTFYGINLRACDVCYEKEVVVSLVDGNTAVAIKVFSGGERAIALPQRFDCISINESGTTVLVSMKPGFGPMAATIDISSGAIQPLATSGYYGVWGPNNSLLFVDAFGSMLFRQNLKGKAETVISVKDAAAVQNGDLLFGSAAQFLDGRKVYLWRPGFGPRSANSNTGIVIDFDRRTFSLRRLSASVPP